MHNIYDRLYFSIVFCEEGPVNLFDNREASSWQSVLFNLHNNDPQSSSNKSTDGTQTLFNKNPAKPPVIT